MNSLYAQISVLPETGPIYACTLAGTIDTRPYCLVPIVVQVDISCCLLYAHLYLYLPQPELAMWPPFRG